MEHSKNPGVQIRVPATANLMLDSTDKTSGTPDNFLIQKGNSILNGFFNRIGCTEFVMDWGIPNISAEFGNNIFTIIDDNDSTTYSITVPDGFYNVAECLKTILALLNIADTNTTFSISSTSFGTTVGTFLKGTNAFEILPTKLAIQLDIVLANATIHQVKFPDLRPFTYIDLVSSQLTYNQELKDATTAPSDKNVIIRFYMAYTDIGALGSDGYNFPILMGYNTFTLLRPYNYPKQIRWNSSQPIGQLAFELYGSDDRLISSTFPTLSNQLQWLATLQVSEN